MKSKKILAGFMALIMVAGATILPASESGIKFSSAISASADEDQSGNVFEYRILSDGTAEIINCYLNNSDVVIPSKVNGIKVTSIGENAFRFNLGIKSVVIPDGVKKIGAGAFFQSSAKSVKLPDSITTIGKEAFSGCSFSTVRLPKHLKTIPEKAFFGSFIESITIPNSVKTIEKEAFSVCENLKKIKIPNSVTKIGQRAFSHCTNLTSVSLPGTVKTIEEGTFCHCRKLKSIRIPYGVKTIGGYAFQFCGNLSKVIIPNSVKVIKEQPFDCTKMGNFYYEGTKAQWKKVVISKNEYILRGANVGKYATAHLYFKKAPAKKTSVVKPKKTSAKLSSTKGRIKVTLKKAKGAKKYQIQYATNKKFKSAKKITTTLIKKSFKAKSKKTYYVRVRSINGKYVSGWSAVKKIKVK